MTGPGTDLGAVVIGRNEGEALVACLHSLLRDVAHVVYVDSGSTDGSVEAATGLGCKVVALDTSIPFTAARARNAGLAALQADHPGLAYVQFVDGDCELQPGWITQARAHLQAHPDIAVVCGRRRERFPEQSRYNSMIDAEWDTPVGEALACGGDALMRMQALTEVGGYRDSLIAGEEPELCVRLRQAGWRVWRLDAEMTLHDAKLTRFSQWWQRSKRAGHAYAEGAALHGAPPERHFVTQTRRALIWGAGLPLAALVAAVLVGPWGLLILLAWPAQMLRLAARGMPLTEAVFTVLGKLPELFGVGLYWRRRLMRRRATLIEYK